MEKNKRILIVDDQQDLREQLAKLLKRAGKKNESTSLVQQMRQRLSAGGAKSDDDKDPFPEDTYEVKVASQGEEAFNMVKKALEDDKPFAVLFTDMRMPPGWDGMETSKKIRDIDKNIEIVIMTAYADHDQATIAETVGFPDKLLYIKKPFQAEEIYQLALCLTTKWNSEEVQRFRREWLESVVRSMSKVKTAAAGKDGRKLAYSTALKAILSFTSSNKGFLCVWSDESMKWEVKCVENLEEKEACAFISENEARLSESKTTQNFQGRYLLPLKRDGFSSVVVIYDVVTQSDPEWYKLLTLLSMTASEALSGAAMSEAALNRERKAAFDAALSRVSGPVRGFASKVKGLMEKIPEPARAQTLAEYERTKENLIAEFRDIDLSNEKGGDCKKLKLSALMDEVFAGLPKDGGVSVVKKIGGVELEISGYPEQLKKAFSNIVSSIVKMAAAQGKNSVSVEIEAGRVNGMAAINISEPVVEISSETADKFFHPFFVHPEEEGKFGLEMHAVERIVQNHSGTVTCSKGPGGEGVRFVVRLPSPQQ